MQQFIERAAAPRSGVVRPCRGAAAGVTQAPHAGPGHCAVTRSPVTRSPVTRSPVAGRRSRSRSTSPVARQRWSLRDVAVVWRRTLRGAPGPACLPLRSAGEGLEDAMTLETFLLWIAVEPSPGSLASMVVGGGFGLLATSSSAWWGLRGRLAVPGAGVARPVLWIAGTVSVAFVGAVCLSSRCAWPAPAAPAGSDLTGVSDISYLTRSLVGLHREWNRRADKVSDISYRPRSALVESSGRRLKFGSGCLARGIRHLVRTARAIPNPSRSTRALSAMLGAESVLRLCRAAAVGGADAVPGSPPRQGDAEEHELGPLGAPRPASLHSGGLPLAYGGAGALPPSPRRLVALSG